MVRYSILFVLACIGATEMASADHLSLFHPHPVIVAPVVAYQPAYVVPVATHFVAMPVPVAYAASYYAPLVPVSAAPVVYAPPVYVAPVYTAPVLSCPVYGRSVHSRLNVYRNGNINYRVRVR